MRTVASTDTEWRPGDQNRAPGQITDDPNGAYKLATARVHPDVNRSVVVGTAVDPIDQMSVGKQPVTKICTIT